MTDLFTTIVEEKGTDFIIEQLKKTIVPKDGMHYLLERIDSIEEKLGQLIDAPYLESIIYLKEGNYEKFKEKIVTAIANNYMNIPARLAYIYILCNDNQYELAADYLIELYRDFTQRKELFPSNLLAEFNSNEKKTFKISNDLNITYLENNYYPLQFYFFPSYFIIIWGHRRTLFGIRWYSSQYLVCYNWNGNSFFSTKANNCHVVFMSYHYILYNTNGDNILYDLVFKKISRITENDATKIFGINNSNLKCDYNFLEDIGEKIVSDICIVRKGEKFEWEYSYEVPCYYDGGDFSQTVEKTKTYKCGSVDIISKK